MAPALVQSNSFDGGFAGGTTATCTPGASATTVGNYLIAMASIGANTTIAFSDNAGNTWSTVTSRYWANVGSIVAIGWAKVATGQATTVTATYGTSGVFRSMVVGEYSGVASSAPVDTFTAGNNQSANTTVSDVSMTTTAADDLVVSALVSDGGVVTAGSGFTLLAYNSGSASAMEYQVKTAAGAITCTATQGTAVQAIIVSAAFLSGGGGPPPYPFELLTPTPRYL